MAVDPDKKKLQNSSNIKILGGFAFVAAMFGILYAVNGQFGTTDLPPDTSPATLLLLIAAQLGAIVLLCWGGADYAKSKGYSPLLGLAGIFGCCGLIILVLLPDRWNQRHGNY